MAIKGTPTVVFLNEQTARMSDVAIDCREFNALHVSVLIPPGSVNWITLRVHGSAQPGGVYQQLPDEGAYQPGVDANTSFDLRVGSAWAKVEIAEILGGLFNPNTGITVTVTPYVAAGNSPAVATRRYVFREVFRARAVTSNDVFTSDVLSGFGGMRMLLVTLSITSKVMDAGTTLDITVETSPNEGISLDTIGRFTQITSAAMATGTYVMKIVNSDTAGFADRVLRTWSELAANSVDTYFADRIRFQVVPANFSGTDSLIFHLRVIGMS